MNKNKEAEHKNGKATRTRQLNNKKRTYTNKQ